MASAMPKASAPRTTWEANCLFCGGGLPDEGAGFLDHVAKAPDCRERYDQWLANLESDWHGGD